MSDEEIDAIWATNEINIDDDEIKRAQAAAGEDEVICRECARPLGQITAQHLQIHGSTLDAYREKHPDAPVYPEAESRKPGRKEGFRHPEEVKQKIADVKRGTTHSDETKRKIGASVRAKHEEGAYE